MSARKPRTPRAPARRAASQRSAKVGKAHLSQRQPSAGQSSASAEPQAHHTRAEQKLADAAQAFGYDFRGKTVLDIGSSTGGFTSYALRRGAARVIAVEKGSHQMRAPLRFHPQLTLLEKTDFLTLKGAQIGPVDTILADVSFISLTKIIKYAIIEVAGVHTDFLVMLKPQFEAKPAELVHGIVKNERIRREIIRRFELWLQNQGLVILAKRDNLISGRNGNKERFYWLKLAHTTRGRAKR